MPSYEIALPPGAKNIRIKTSTQEIPVDWQFYRHGKDGAEVIVPLFGGDEFVGEVLEGMWKKGDDGSIQGPFTAKLNGSGSLELTGRSDTAGTPRAGWIKSRVPIIYLDDTVVDIHLQLPSHSDSESFGVRFILTKFFPNGDPDGERTALLDLWLWTNTTTYSIMIRKCVNGTWINLLGNTAVTNGEGIFRIRFEESKTGHNHTHFYYHDGSGEVDEAVDEISGSPFDLEDSFIIGYPAFRFFSLETTNRTVSSDFVRVTYPDFKVVYDLDDDDVNKGDVKCYDTMNSSDESDWIRVLDPSHKFVGDCVVENGLIRLWIDEGTQYGLKFYYWDGDSWVHEGSLVADQRTPSAAIDYPYLESLQSVSTEQATVRVKLSESSLSNNYLEMNITISRGSYTVKCLMMNKDTSDYFIEYHIMTSARFRATSNAVRDDNVTSDNSDSVLTDNFAIAFDPDQPILHIICGSVKPDASIYLTHYYHPRIVWNDFLASDMNEGFINVNLVPFSKVSNLFKEAEDVTLSSGATVDTTQTDDSGDSVLLDVQYDWVKYTFKGGTDLPKGRYIAFVRAKDTNNIPNDFWIQVYNETDAKFIDEAKGGKLYTLSSDFAYYSLVFDITDDDVGDTLRILAEKDKADANSIYVDYFLIVPIGNGESWAQDLAHNAMRTFEKEVKVYPR